MRSFIALSIDQETKEKIEQLKQALYSLANFSKLKWVKKENFHLTIKFLGDIDQITAEKLEKIIEEISSNYNPLPSYIKKIRFFPNNRYPRVLFLYVENPSLFSLANQINNKIPSINPKKPEKFHPHITLARIKQQKLILSEKIIEEFEKRYLPIELTFTTLCLYESFLSAQGASYRIIKSSKFKKTI